MTIELELTKQETEGGQTKSIPAAFFLNSRANSLSSERDRYEKRGWWRVLEARR